MCKVNWVCSGFKFKVSSGNVTHSDGVQRICVIFEIVKFIPASLDQTQSQSKLIQKIHTAIKIVEKKISRYINPERNWKSSYPGAPPSPPTADPADKKFGTRYNLPTRTLRQAGAEHYSTFIANMRIRRYCRFSFSYATLHNSVIWL